MEPSEEAGSSSSAASPAAAAESPRRKQFFPPDKSVYTTCCAASRRRRRRRRTASTLRAGDHALLDGLRARRRFAPAALAAHLHRQAVAAAGVCREALRATRRGGRRPRRRRHDLLAVGLPRAPRRILPFVHGSTHATAVKVKDGAGGAGGGPSCARCATTRRAAARRRTSRGSPTCAEYPGVQLEQLVAEALATPLPKPKAKAKEGAADGDEEEDGDDDGAATGKPVTSRRRRSGWSAARCGCRAHDGADGLQPPPYTKAMVAMLRGAAAPAVGRGERRARAVASRRHFEVGRRRSNLASRSLAFIAGAEGTERPNQEYAEKWRKVARRVQAMRRPPPRPAAPRLARRQAPPRPRRSRGRSGVRRCPEAGGGGDPAAQRTLPPMTRRTRALPGCGGSTRRSSRAPCGGRAAARAGAQKKEAAEQERRYGEATAFGRAALHRRRRRRR